MVTLQDFGVFTVVSSGWSQVHRHHLGLRWPEGPTSLAERPVLVRVDEADDRKHLFWSLSRLSGQRFSRLQDVQLEP